MSLGDFAPSWIASEGLDHNLSLGPHAKLLGMDTALMDLEDASHSWALDFLAFPKIRWKISSNQLKSTHFPILDQIFHAFRIPIPGAAHLGRSGREVPWDRRVGSGQAAL